MTTLRQLVQTLGGEAEFAGAGPEVGGIQLDSREVGAGDAFAALPGTRADGARFIADAVARGAVVVLTPHELDLRALPAPPPVQWIHPHARAVVGRLAAHLAGDPSRELGVAGVTGTNGKTTTVHILGHLLEQAGQRPGVIGTTGYRLAGGTSLPSTHTTPDGPVLQRLLRAHLDAGGRSIAMEVSSHALVQERTAGIDFDVAVFTNLTREHLDYHGDMECYKRAKALLFERLGRDSAAILNRDDPAWADMAEAARASGARVLTYGTQSRVDLRADQLRAGPQGSLFLLDGMGITSTELRLPLRGRYNVENALAAAAAALAMGASPSDVLEGLATTSTAPGRLEWIPTGNRGFELYVDYAHSPSALERVLTTLRAGMPDSGRLLLVFGCGGERDSGKRPEMGRVAARLADVAIVTNDNPRSENPERIAEHILAGMGGGTAEQVVQLERREAIDLALRMARPGDRVLLAGKGHETGQTIGDETLSFDDRTVALEVLT